MTSTDIVCSNSVRVTCTCIIFLILTGTKELATDYEAAKAQLEENDTYTQVYVY